MKITLFKILFTVLILFGLSGCYTIVWSPNSEFPTQDNSDNSTIYYGDNYYGDYYYYYDTPWWYDYAPPVPSKSTPTREENTDIGRLRDTGSDRSDPGRIPEVQPPSRNQNDSGSNVDKGSSNNSGNTSSDNSSRNSSSGSGNSDGSGSTRNDNGGRSSGGRK